MKTYYLLFVAILVQLNLFAQGNGTYQDFTIQVDDQPRKFKLYTPPGVDPSESAPLVLVFHGFGGSMSSMIQLTEFYQAADTAGFYLAYVQGLPVTDILYSGATSSGWAIPNSASGPQDDVKFVNQIIDTLVARNTLTIDESQIYASGFSLGGEFTYYLGCKLSDRIAAIAAVSAGMIKEQIDGVCIPVKKISALHMVGTADPFYPFQGNIFFYPFYTTPGFWSALNNCDVDPDISRLEDKDPNDGSTVDLAEYLNCDGDLEVLSYKINNGSHAWPGGQDFPSAVVNFDINASDEIWKFFSRHSLNEQTSSIKDFGNSGEIEIFPNPFVDQIILQNLKEKNVQIDIFNYLGVRVFGEQIKNIENDNPIKIDLPIYWNEGIYILVVKSPNGNLHTTKIIKG